MTVAELIESLKELPQDMEIMVMNPDSEEPRDITLVSRGRWTDSDGLDEDTVVDFETEIEPGEFIHTFGDVHIYKNHIEQAREQLTRAPRALPRVRINPSVKDIDAFRFEDFTLEDYDPLPAIKAQISV